MANPPLLLRTADFTSYLNEKCMQLAPGDVKTLLGAGGGDPCAAPSRWAADHPRMQRQIDFALTLIEEHHKGRCPQIPYYAIATLCGGAALFQRSGRRHSGLDPRRRA